MDNDKRGTPYYQNMAGLVVTNDYDGYYDPQLLSYDSRGVLHELQYYPRIDDLSPMVGSVAGGTEITILGGGFSMDESANSVTIGGKACKVTYSTLEEIRCNTTATENATDAFITIDHESGEATTGGPGIDSI